MTNELLKAFDGAVRAAEKRSDVLGRLGRIEPDGSITVPADRPGTVHVRLGPEGSLGQSIARNAANVPLRAHLPVRMRRENGVLVIHGLDYEGGRIEAALANDAPSPTGVAKHHHRIGSGLEYEVQALLLEPGRVRAHSGMVVWINPFFYTGPTGRAWWPGGTLDLTPYQPGAGQWAWVLVGIDPATNAAVAATGDAVGSIDLLTTMGLADVDLGDALPCAGIKVSGDDTAIRDVSRFTDAREWLNRGGGGGSLATLSDVEISGPSEDEVLMYIMGKWRNTALIPPTVYHGSLPDLWNDDHPQYALLVGRAGHQVIHGGREAAENLILDSTWDDTKGIILLQPAGGDVGIGTWVPGGRLAIRRSDAGMLLDLGDGAITEGGIPYGTGFYRAAVDNSYVILNFVRAVDTNIWLGAGVAGDSQRRFVVQANGRLSWGSGSADRDTQLGRSAQDVLLTPDRLAAHGYGLTGTKTNIASGSATALADIVVSPATIMYAMLVGLTVSGSGVASGQVWAVTGGWNAVGINKLSEGLYGHSSIVLSGSMTTATRTLRLTVTQTNGTGVPCTVNISLLPLMGGSNIISSITML